MKWNATLPSVNSETIATADLSDAGPTGWYLLKNSPMNLQLVQSSYNPLLRIRMRHVIAFWNRRGSTPVPWTGIFSNDIQSVVHFAIIKRIFITNSNLCVAKKCTDSYKFELQGADFKREIGSFKNQKAVGNAIY